MKTWLLGDLEAKAEKVRRLASEDFLAFMIYCWWMTTPFKIGRHTIDICRELTKAAHLYLKGVRTYIIINIPYRHGKSDMVSRAFPAFFLGIAHKYGLNPKVILSSYGASLTEGFSSDCQDIVRSEAYQAVFPGVEIGKSSAAEWSVKDSKSRVYATGLGGSLTGKGGNLIVLDDYCKNREEAESQGIRDKMWSSFKDDLSTRMDAGGGIEIVCATRWHEDDITGRIFKAMKEIDGYPQYKQLIYPARKEGPDGWNTLFPEMYDESWYDTAFATLGPYASAALLQNDPRGAGERFFRPEWLQVYMGSVDASKLKIMIFIDGAKGKKSKNDYTTMLVIGRGRGGEYYLLDGVHEKLNLYEKIQKLGSDDPNVGLVAKWGGPRRVKCVWWEQVGPMSDVESVRIHMSQTMYHFTIRELNHNQNKDFRIKRLAVPLSQIPLNVPTQIIRTRIEHSSDGSPDKVVAYDFMQDFRAEYDGYTGNCEDLPHDDIIDCLADIMDDDVLKAFTPPEGGMNGVNSSFQDGENWAKNIRRRGLR